jgi:hypothetical protein
MNSDTGMGASRPSLNMALVLAIVFLTVVSIMQGNLPSSGLLPRWTTAAYGWALVFANFAITAIGIRTPQRNAWLIYLGASLLALIAMGMATPLAALWYLPRLLQLL